MLSWLDKAFTDTIVIWTCQGLSLNGEFFENKSSFWHFLNFLIAEELFLTSYQLSQVNRILISYYSSTHLNFFVYLILINPFISFISIFYLKIHCVHGILKCSNRWIFYFYENKWFMRIRLNSIDFFLYLAKTPRKRLYPWDKTGI